MSLTATLAVTLQLVRSIPTSLLPHVFQRDTNAVEGSYLGPARQLALEHVPEDVHHLLRRLRGRHRSPIDLFERVVVLVRVQADDRLAERRGEAGVEGRVPLLVLLPEAHDDDVRLPDQRLRADRVDPGALMVLPEAIGLVAENRHADVIGGAMIGDRRAEGDVEAGIRGALGDALAPVGVDLAGEVDVPGHRESYTRPPLRC